MNGTVTDTSGAVVQGVTVKIHSLATNLEVDRHQQGGRLVQHRRLAHRNLRGLLYKRRLPDRGLSANYRARQSHGDRKRKLNPGKVSSTVTVSATPLLNETDTTTGYVLDRLVIDNTPLGTGSFTQLAILSPGVNADLLNTAGTNAGFGNQSIWANGQRDSSNSFQFNGVNANNIFNGKSSSQLTSGELRSMSDKAITPRPVRFRPARPCTAPLDRLCRLLRQKPSRSFT